jgi:hypothetical protein
MLLLKHLTALVLNLGLKFIMWSFSAGNVWFKLFPGSHKISVDYYNKTTT